jgi:hypothetical protein
MKFNYVRIFTLFILLVSVGVFTSCSSISDNDDDTDTSVNALAGNWKLVGASFSGGEVADASEFEGFTLAFNSTGTYELTNPKSFYSPTAASGTYQSSGQFLTFDGGTSVTLLSLGGNSMVWEWQVSRPGKITATYRYTFEKI